MIVLFKFFKEINMLSEMSFANLVLNGFYVRILFVILSVVISVRIIGYKNIFFLKKYVERGFFSISKIFYWAISLISILYFQHLISTANSVSVTSSFEHNYFFSLLVLASLFGVIMYSFIYMMGSIADAKNTKSNIEKAQFGKNCVSVLGFASFFVPGGLIVKGLAFGGTRLFDSLIDNGVKTTLSEEIRQSLNSILMIISINLFIVLGTTYLVTGQVIFW